MAKLTLGIIGGGQLGSMLCIAAKKIGINTIIFCDDENAPGKNFCDEFIFGKYESISNIEEFSKNSEIRYVGGCVRKVINNEVINDIDLAVNLNPDEV